MNATENTDDIYQKEVDKMSTDILGILAGHDNHQAMHALCVVLFEGLSEEFFDNNMNLSQRIDALTSAIKEFLTEMADLTTNTTELS